MENPSQPPSCKSCGVGKRGIWRAEGETGHPHPNTPQKKTTGLPNRDTQLPPMAQPTRGVSHPPLSESAGGASSSHPRVSLREKGLLPLMLFHERRNRAPPPGQVCFRQQLQETTRDPLTEPGTRIYCQKFSSYGDEGGVGSGPRNSSFFASVVAAVGSGPPGGGSGLGWEAENPPTPPLLPFLDMGKPTFSRARGRGLGRGSGRGVKAL